MQRTHLLPALGGLLVGGLVLAAGAAGPGGLAAAGDGDPCPSLLLCSTPGSPALPAGAAATGSTAGSRPTLDAADLVVARATDDLERGAAPVLAPGADPGGPPPARQVPDPEAEPGPLAGVDLGARPADPWRAPVDPLARPDATPEQVAEWYAGSDVGHLVRQELRLRRVLAADLSGLDLTPVQAARVAELREIGDGLVVERDWLAHRLWELQNAEADGVRWIAPQPLEAFAARLREADHEDLLELRWRLDRQLRVEHEHAIEVLFSTGRFTRTVDTRGMLPMT